MPAPTEITSPLHFRTLLTTHTYLIADFYATWCPPCKQIAPIYAKLSDTHTTAGGFVFVKVNVDEQNEIAAQYGIQAMPTFLLFKDGKKVEEVKGANPPVLKKIVENAAIEVKAAGEKKAKEAEVKKAEELKKSEPQEEKIEVEEKTVSGSYGMSSGGNNWKQSLY
jgi:thioredoxin 1